MFTCLKGGHLRTNLTNLHNILTHLQKSFASWQIDTHQKRYLLYMWERIRVTIIISAVLRRILNDYCSLFCKSVLFHPQFDESLLNNLPKIFDISTWALTCIPWTLTLRTRTTVYFTPLCNHQYFCCWCCISILPVCCWLICNSKLGEQSQMFVLRQVASHGDITGHILSTAFVLCGVDINLQYNNLVVCLHPMKNNASFRIITSSINIIYVCQSHVHRLCSSLHYILRH